MRDAITDLDDTLCHQTSDTFNQVGTTDHRFMDRYWYMTVAPDRSVGLVTGLGAYPNMNTFDGYACVVVDQSRQLNTRVSRKLRPDIDRLGSGPLSYTNEISHQRNHVLLTDNAGPLRLNLSFEADEPPRLEAPHRTFIEGLLVEDYRRLHQGGTMRGTITVGDRSWNVQDWYAAKDHSWGVRSHFGGSTIVRAGISPTTSVGSTPGPDSRAANTTATSRPRTTARRIPRAAATPTARSSSKTRPAPGS
jgi:hypothetical protein